MILKLFKKAFGRKKAPEELKQDKSLAVSLREKSGDLLTFVSKKTEEAQTEFFSIKKKLKNLRQTNYDLAVKHAEKGNLSYAIFRLRCMKRFWPDFFEVYYTLAYYLALHGKPLQAQYFLQELLTENPNYDQTHEHKAQDLLDQINAAAEQNSIDVTKNS